MGGNGGREGEREIERRERELNYIYVNIPAHTPAVWQ